MLNPALILERRPLLKSRCIKSGYLGVIGPPTSKPLALTNPSSAFAFMKNIA